jgi:integrase
MRPAAIETLADLRAFVSALDLPAHRRRDLLSCIETVSAMLGRSPQEVPANAPELRLLIGTIRPAAHGIKGKTLSNLRSLLAAALKLGGQLDELPRGLAKRDTEWQVLMNALFLVDKPTGCGLSKFANWCAYNNINPHDVSDQTVRDFFASLETRSLHAAPRDLVRQVPIAWKRARTVVENWPAIELGRVSFKSPQLRIPWSDLPERFRQEAEAYLSLREKPCIFDESDAAPTRALAASTVRQQREHLRIAASILIRQHGAKPGEMTLSHLISPTPFKAVLQSLLDQSVDKHQRKLVSAGAGEAHLSLKAPPNAFVICLAMTLVHVARYYVKVHPAELQRLKYYKSKLPRVPLDLTDKNKRLLTRLEVPATQAKLFFLPELLRAQFADAQRSGRFDFVAAEVALAIELQLVLPLRPQNLQRLNWRRHFNDLESAGLRLLIPAEETKSKQKDIVADIPAEIANRINWYRRNVLPKLGGSEHGDLFITQGGARKDQKTLAGQIIDRIAVHVGLHMTPHQFRHFAAFFYLEGHPNDFETVKNLLGHAFIKTTSIYAGSSGRRSGVAYSNFVFQKKDELRIYRSGKHRKSGRSSFRLGS